MKTLEVIKSLSLLEQKKKQVDMIYERERKNVIDQCEHDWTYHSDPSGNNDSGYSCSGCGTWTKRLP